MTEPSVEIAGAGIAGLATAIALSQKGWQATVHERSAELREEGAAIALGESALAALAELGASLDVIDEGEAVDEWLIIDHRGRTLQKGGRGEGRSCWIRRSGLQKALLTAAARAGVTIRLGSDVTGADPDGALLLADGRRLEADLVVGADGVHSAVRGSLPSLEARKIRLGHLGIREHVQFDEPIVERHVSPEYWSGRRRLGFCWFTEGELGVYFSCPEKEIEEKDDWFDAESWTRSFPHLAGLMKCVEEHKPTYRPLFDVKCKTWSVGRAVVLGDAAHSMAPHFGQGGAHALQDAVVLGDALASLSVAHDLGELRARLTGWEAERRPFVEESQRWCRRYVRLQNDWPKPLFDLRSALLFGIGRWSSAIKVSDGLKFKHEDEEPAVPGGDQRVR